MKLFARARSRRSQNSAGKTRKTRWRLGLGLMLLIIVFGSIFGVIAFYAVWAQTFDFKRVGEMPERNTVFDVDGKVYSRLAGANRIVVPLKEVSPYFINALIAREDTRFYQHGGLDPRGVARAIFRDITSSSVKEGASTIT
ncbi:MAG: transglycosylase domain-containing protein, partial [Verrucomicrobiota bacterium]|nr:transglycosylase domain-containing protein [Verrucomicrobiota bacterium]